MSSFASQTSLFDDSRVVIQNATCDASVSAGDWVKLDGFGVYIKAQADNITNAAVVGLVEEKLDSTTANILVMGISKDIFLGLDETKEYFLSDVTAGGMLAPPVPVGAGKVVIALGRPLTATRFKVDINIRVIRAV